MGRDGVGVDALVGVKAGEGVMTKKVGELSTGPGLLVGEFNAWAEDVGATSLVLDAGAVAGIAGFGAAALKINNATAPTMNAAPNIIDQRTLATCRLRRR